MADHTMADHHFDAIDNSTILYQGTDDLLSHTILTPYSDQKFDLFDSKADDAPFSYDGHNSLGIYDQYHESGPSSVQFGDGIEASEHGEGHLNGNHDFMNGNVRPGELHDIPGMAGLPLPLSSPHDLHMDAIHVDGSHTSSMNSNGYAGPGAQFSKKSTMAIPKSRGPPILEKITVRA